ncbi:phage tail tape measure protein [Roseateles cavernae]|uniref:phage tail tape measure protein n=1 Tax=Roseateles cavernae TaxID=3153578 RepID=UPI0032E439C2
MANKRKVQIETGVDNTGARKGLGEIKDAAKDMAQSVAQSGQQAAKGVEAVGAGGDAAAAKVERSTRSIISAIQRATAAAKANGTGTADFFQALGEQKGNLESLKPFIEQLRQAERAQQLASGSLDKMGISAKQTAAALRQVPAQFTDIITSLQGGQAPLTVLLQQGGQLKDTFGGVGPAAQALGRYVLGLVNPFSLGAAAAATLGLALYQSAEEQQAFNRTAIITGNVAGVTGERLNEMALAVNRLGAGTRGRAAEVLNDLAQSGAVGAENMSRFTAAALRFERVGGEAAEKTNDAFRELARAPLQAALKLNDATNFLNRSTYERIRVLEELGLRDEAARVAQEAYADSIEKRVPGLEQNLGLLAKAWNGITSAAKGAWDAMLDIGREDTPEQKLAKLRERAASIEQQLASGGFSSTEGGAATGRGLGVQGRKDQQAALEAIREQIRLYERSQAAAATVAAEDAKRAKEIKAAADFDKEGLQYLTRREQIEREVTKARNEGAAAGKSQAEIEKRVAAIREKLDPGIGAARSGSGLADVKRQLGQLTAAYGDAEAILSATRQAGLISEADYYAAKRAFIQLDKDARVRELRGEISALQQANASNKLSTAERIANGDKIKDNLAKITEAEGKAAAATVVLGVQQSAAVSGVAKAYEDARLAAEDYLATLQRGQTRELDLFGASNSQREEARGRDQISDKYMQDRQRIQGERALTAIQQGGILTGEQSQRFDDLLALNRSYEEKALGSYRDYIERRKLLEADWAQGASSAFRNYVDDARKIAGQTESLFVNAFSGAEDALVNFVRTGKLDFKSLADSIIADLARILIKQQLVSAVKTVGSFLGLGFAKGGAFDPSGEVKRFAMGDVFDKPTQFTYGGGRNLGELGEAGPEGVLPLARGAGGKLGVIAHGGSSRELPPIVYAPVTNIDSRSDRAAVMADMEASHRANNRELLALIKDRMRA